MKTAKTKKKKDSSGGGAKEFFVWHGEKIVVCVVVAAALWIALQGLGYLGQPLGWQPDELVRTASEAENAIRASTRSAIDEGIERIEETGAIDSWGHAALARQIRSPILVAPYRYQQPWNPDPNISNRQQRSSSSL